VTVSVLEDSRTKQVNKLQASRLLAEHFTQCPNSVFDNISRTLNNKRYAEYVDYTIVVIPVSGLALRWVQIRSRKGASRKALV
jgi:hypothetical protein